MAAAPAGALKVKFTSLLSFWPSVTGVMDERRSLHRRDKPPFCRVLTGQDDGIAVRHLPLVGKVGAPNVLPFISAVLALKYTQPSILPILDNRPPMISDS